MGTGDWIEIDAGDLPEAMKKAAEQLDVGTDEIEVEHLEEKQQESGLSGDALVRVRARIRPSESLPGVEAGNGDQIKVGLAAVREGKVIIEIPDGAELPVLAAQRGVVLRVDGKETSGPVAIEQGQRLEVELPDQEARSEVEVLLADGRMAARLKVTKTKGRIYRLQDVPLTPRLVLTAELAEEVEPPEMTMEVVKQAIAEKGIKSGIDEKEIAAALESGKMTVIASGKPPLQGQDAYLEKCFQEDIISEASGKVGILHVKEVAIVEPGQMLVIKHPLREGLPGTDVLGNEVPPEAPRDIVLKAGLGVQLSQDGLKATANSAGRPCLEGNVVVVYPRYEVQGDVNAGTGHIRFKGDVLVRGNVLENMEIDAQGQVIVEGSVYHCLIKSGLDLNIIGNAVGATLHCGGSSLLCGRAAARTEEFETKLRQLFGAFEQLKGTKTLAEKISSRGAGVILKGLMETKFSYLPGLVKEWKEETSVVPAALSEDELVDLQQSFMVLLGRGPLSLQTSTELEDFFASALERLVDFRENLRSLAKVRSDLTVSYVQDSNVAASGKVRIGGKGSYQCKVYAGTGVSIDGSPGVFRGGEIKSGGNVFIREIGSIAESETRITVTKECVISAEKVHPGTTLTAGSKVKRFDRYTRQVDFAEQSTTDQAP